MKNKKLWIPIITILVLLVVGIATYFVAFRQDKNTTLTLLEKQWIENNKSKLPQQVRENFGEKRFYC